MANKTTMRLKANQLSYLGKASGQVLSDISPLNGPASELSKSEIEELKTNGVLGGSGAIADGFRPALETLASANAFARTRLTKGRGMLEYVVYFSPNSEPCSLLTENEGFWLEYPAASSEFMPLLEELLGTSSLRNMDFEAQFDRNQGLVLSAAMDLTRLALLKSLIDENSSVNADISPEDIDKWLGKPASDAQWLSSVIKGVIPASDLELSSIISAMDKLVASGFMMKNETQYLLSERVATLTSRFLIIDKLMSMRAGASSNANVKQVGFICLSAGVNDLLMLEADENSIFMEAVSARQVMDFTNHLLNEPMQPSKEAIAGSINTQPSSPETAQLKCPNCGGAILATSKFCGSCGSLIKPAPAFCGKCGAEIKEGTRFCGGCGSPL